MLFATGYLVAALAGSVAGDELWRDDFHEARTYERFGPRCWHAANGVMAFRAGSETSWQIARMPDLAEATTRCTVQATERTTNSYAWVGVVLFQDPANQWMLSLVESPEGKRYLELLERLDGVQHAQSSGGTSATMLPVKHEGTLESWEYGHEYRLELTHSVDGITGTITDPETGAFWRRGYDFGESETLRVGRAGMVVYGLIGEVRELTVEGAPPEGEPGLEVAAGPLGRVAVLDSERGGLAVPWAKALQAEGFGAMPVTWDDLRTKTIRAGDIDLLLLADARTVPLQARDTVMDLARSSGKLIAVGAPAFLELRGYADGRWRNEAGYQDAVLAKLDRTPMELSADRWSRSAQHQERESAIRQVDVDGQSAWEIDLDLDGWDGFAQDIAGAFGEGETLLTFWARGDGETSQIYVECREQDGSRWIATVDITPEWRGYALRPRDLLYWQDSPPGRGWEGDHFHPEDVEATTIGLSGSHTPRVKTGRHRFWVRGMATAVDPDRGKVAFTIPELAGVSPSHQLFPVETPMRLTAGLPGTSIELPDLTWRDPAYSPVWRERGRGFDRDRSWRWIPLLERRDAEGFHRGALMSLTIGDSVCPDAMWAQVGVRDPEDVLGNSKLKRAVVETARAMVRGCFLIEAGAPVFSCEPGEEVGIGAEVLNAGHEARELMVSLTTDTAGADGQRGSRTRRESVSVSPGRRATVKAPFRAPDAPGTYHVTTMLVTGTQGEIIDRIDQEIVVQPRPQPTSADYVRVEGSRFMLGDKPWLFKGINYRPTFIAGYPHLNFLVREVYDPEIIERDLAWMESMGMNAMSAVPALQPPDPAAPWAFSDEIDFLDRCERHGIKVFFFLPYARPFADANAETVMSYLDRSGIKDHPAVMCWELAWEPIHGSWGDGEALSFMREPWNDWVVERYGSVESATADWEYEPEMAEDGKLPIPTHEMTISHGEWDRMVAAFRRAFSDTLSRGYLEMVTPLRELDPNHLISFRFGACGIPNGQTFAHAHSQGALKHVDFMNPEGYSLIKGWTIPTPPDDLRKGGLVTLYYRHFSREKPVVWMEFGFTVNGIFDEWQQDRIHIDPTELELQRKEYEGLYAMFIESGARGFAPWWLPGGFRIGENSDFGVVAPDGSERPACEVIRKYAPLLDGVMHDEPTASIELDLDGHYADAWETYSAEYLRLVKAGERPEVRTAGTGTTSANCPLTAVGGTEYNGHNPPIYLNAEFNRLEIGVGDGEWIKVEDGAAINVPAGQTVRCRASAGNIGEAGWLALRGEEPGGVQLHVAREPGIETWVAIEADTPFLEDADVAEFLLAPEVNGEVTVSFRMYARGRAYFGERRTITLRPVR